MERSFDILSARLGAVGLNLVGATSVTAYDASVPAAHALGPRHPGARGVVVVGHGGGAFWDAFAAAGPPAGADPLDAFTRRVVGDALGPLAPGERLLFPFADPVSFVHLAEAAGLGRRSLLGLLIHPVHGPWIAFRAALLLPSLPRAPRPADGFDPCPSCTTRPCIAACPAGAVSAAGWDVPRCADARLADDDPCAGGCRARLACVHGQADRLPPAALAFHQAAARRGMAAGR
jgi:hypothetical protein